MGRGSHLPQWLIYHWLLMWGVSDYRLHKSVFMDSNYQVQVKVSSTMLYKFYPNNVLTGMNFYATYSAKPFVKYRLWTVCCARCFDNPLALYRNKSKCLYKCIEVCIKNKRDTQEFINIYLVSFVIAETWSSPANGERCQSKSRRPGEGNRAVAAASAHTRGSSWRKTYGVHQGTS